MALRPVSKPIQHVSQSKHTDCHEAGDEGVRQHSTEADQAYNETTPKKP